MNNARFARLAALGAIGASVGIVLLFILFAYFVRPTRIGGMNWSTTEVTWVSLAVCVLILVAGHLHAAKELFAISRDRLHERVPL